MKPIRIATRKSRLALWQSNCVADQLRQQVPGIEVELLPMSTRGDEVLDRSLAEIGGKGLFLKELEVALLEDRADIAVHSLKDVPAEQPDGLILGAFLARADAGDLWISRDAVGPADLPAGRVVGSSSLRRISQLHAIRPDIEVIALRGNVETRIAAVQQGRVAATVLAAAGLNRLGIVPEGAIALSVEHWLPAPGQGIIAIQCRLDDRRVIDQLAGLNCPMTALQARCERAVVEALGGDCRMPLAAYADVRGSRLDLHARLGGLGGQLIDARVSGKSADAVMLGRSAAAQLLANGGKKILERLNLFPSP
ncbi:MAG: hydroxymethylbilane synthase [Xanthomonadaceae bacterium]|nr:hydroxymethylbilane synthase [Xanthomonadaceae bacterium]